MVERELLKAREWRPLYSYAKAYQGIVDDISAISLGRILAGTRDRKVSKARHMRQSVDERGHIRRGVEEGWILLGQDVAQFRRAIFWPLDDGCHRGVRGI